MTDSLREQVDLNSEWRFLMDGSLEGEAAGFADPQHDDSTWRAIELPRSFDQCGPALEGYDSGVWFRRRFSAPETWYKRSIAVRFEGVNYHARVWINGHYVGRNDCGFLPFEFNLNSHLRWGEENTIAVLVDGQARPDEVPGTRVGWRPFAGILREVSLRARNPLRLEDVAITGEPSDNGGLFSLRARVHNDAEETPPGLVLQTEVRDFNGNTLAHFEQSVTTNAGIKMQGEVAGAVPWSPQLPVLYQCVLNLCHDEEVIDNTSVRFGFRKVEVRGKQLLLNGQPLYLTGFNRHEDSPRTGMATDLETARHDLEDIKAMGCNFVRLCHYPHHPGELDLCDELGLLAMVEIPAYWTGQDETWGETFQHQEVAAEAQLRIMIARDFNHPSIIFWSVSNETCEQHAPVDALNKRLLKIARELDPSRLVVHVSNHWRNTPSFDGDDVICVTGYPNWPHENSDWPWPDGVQSIANSGEVWRRALAALHQHYPDKPIMVAEFGYPCLEGERAGRAGEDTAAAAMIEEFKGMQETYVCGALIWCYAMHPWPFGNRFWWGHVMSPFGVVTRERKWRAHHEPIAAMFRQHRTSRQR